MRETFHYSDEENKKELGQTNIITLKRGRDKTARQFHPWIFSGAIAHADKGISPGDVVKVVSDAGEFVAHGYYNPLSQISIRLLDWSEKSEINDAWWLDKIRASIARRKHLAEYGSTNAYRLVFSESDLLPGLIVDRYANFVVVQYLTAGVESARGIINSALERLTTPAGIYERSDIETRVLEGLEPRTGAISGNDPPDLLEIAENGHKFLADIKTGQKSGSYLDQRENRQAVSRYAAGLDLLDCFSYSGGFSVYALSHGAKSVTLVEASAKGLELARRNVLLNELDIGAIETATGDVFKVLRQFRAAGRMFDMVILDPPKFAPTKADLKKALSGYKDINLLALQLLRPDGILATFSCSGAVDPQTLQTVLFWASADSGRQVQILQSLFQGEDHPRLASFPESEYLKGFICRVL